MSELDAKIAEARAAIDAHVREGAIDKANVASYNLAADLADCWPDDDVPRMRAHFEAGLRAAEDCVRWREELGKPPDRQSIAHWAVGMHRFSLGDVAGARAALERALDLAEADDMILLNRGYLALARWRLGEAQAEEDYREAVAGLEALDADDAPYCIAQLEVVRTKYI